MSGMSRLATDILLHPNWEVSAAGALWTRTLSNGQLAAIWRYTDDSGAHYYKLLTDRDMGDYVALDFAVAAAVVVESLGAVTVAS